MAKTILPPEGAPTPANSVTAADRYNATQLKLVLQDVASKADILRAMLVNLAQEVGDHQLEYQAHAAEALASMIGAAADLASGGEVVGGYEEWLYGHQFKEAACQ